jgi:uncharacterized BrkB/YihY/UPF0761 family membrane protein
VATAPEEPTGEQAELGAPGSPADVGGGSRRTRARLAEVRRRADGTAERASAWFDERRERALPYDLAASFYERDRDTFASVLGAALAMRLFLFLVPFVVLAVGLLLVVSGSGGVDAVIDGAGVAGTMAGQIRSVTDATRSGGLALMGTGLVLALWAGRSLTRVLAACSAGAWGITGRESKATLKMAGTVTGLIALLLFLTAFLNRAREQFSLPLATTSWAATVVLVSLGWFAVTWSLPRRTSDPGALLPGAAFTGVTLTALQWFMQYYLPGRIERASDLTGALGVTIAGLGYMFLIGRIMSSSLILNAVIWEHVGSVSGVVFALPVLRRIPERSPAFARFFDLRPTVAAGAPGPTDPAGDVDGGGPPDDGGGGRDAGRDRGRDRRGSPGSAG